MATPPISALGFPGGVPAFPSTDTLEASSFKVVVGSWRRINPATTSTSDFTVDVSTYAPKTPYVTRVQLVDVDIPHAQQLIESAWSRVYFQQGVPISKSNRSMEIVTDGVVNSVVLPLAIDKVRMYQRLDSGTTRLFMTHQAPAPLASIAELWNCLPTSGLKLMGVPAYPDGFLLTPANVNDSCAGGVLALDIVSYDLADALEADNHQSALYLTAGPIPGPSYLAAIMSKASTDALVNSCIMDSLYAACDGPPVRWQFQFTYSVTDDKFSLHARVPPIVSEVYLVGQLAEYMGFGSRMPVVFDPDQPRMLLTPALNVRVHPRDGYARLPNDSPRRPEELAASLQAAFNAYEWAAFSFGIQFPGLALQTINVPGGRMTLRQLAESITALTISSQIVVTYTTTDSGDKSGLRFENLDKNVFYLDFTLDPTFAPSLIGYERRVLPALWQHFPTRAAVHVPFPNGTPPMSDLWVLYNADTQQILIQSVPFKAFSAFVSMSNGPINTFTITTDNHGAFKHGLQPGANVVLAANVQVHGVVISVQDLTTFSVLVSEPLVVNTDVTVVPQDRMPIDLYFQITSSREKSVYASLLGFQPITYEGVTELLAPGTIDIRQDPYLLLCLSFQAEDITAQCGNVHYPFENNSQLIFGKILKSAVAFRAEYDRMFCYDFRGTGIHLGYIRVRILNSDGTLFETHGHPVSVCLKFDVRQSGVALGGPGTVMQIPKC